MEKELQIEFETKLNKTILKIMVPEQYTEDYQLPMLQHNHIVGVLDVKGWEEEGKSCYSYDVSNLTSMKTCFEKTLLRQENIKQLVHDLLETVTDLQNHMLNPDCIVLDPRYIFRKKEQWYFCYLPIMSEDFQFSFHELTEYFVKTLDYSDTEGIFLAYELHKSTLEEHYDLTAIMKEYDEHREERKQQEEQEIREELDSVEEQDIKMVRSHQTEDNTRFEEMEREDIFNLQDEMPIREEKSHYFTRKKTKKRFSKKSWGKWDDLIMETDGQEKDAAL